MRNPFITAVVALFVVSLFFCPSGTCQRKDVNAMDVQTFRCQGLDRQYYLYIPDDMPQGAPLVFFLHGYGSSLRHQRSFYKLADEEKFAVCVPWAAVDTEGKHGWNVGYAVQKGYRTDDVLFLKKLAIHLHKEYGTSKENVFVTGHSNGGEMCYLIAYREPEFFRAVAPLSGLLMKWMYDTMTPRKSIPLLEIHGTADDTSLWNGVPDDSYWGPYLSVPLAVSIWAVAAHCDHEVTEVLPPLCPESRKVIAHKYYPSDGSDIEVQLYEIVGCGHGLSLKDLDYPKIVWDFFKKYVK